MVKTVNVFSWEAVDEALTRALLIAVYEASGRHDDAAKLQKQDRELLVLRAARVLGRPLAARHMESVSPLVDVLLERWLPSLPTRDLAELTARIQLSLGEPDRSAEPKSKKDLVAFIRARRRTKNLLKNLRSAFLRAHKVAQEVSALSVSERGEYVHPRQLTGEGVVPRVPYTHQLEAWNALDELSATDGRRAGLLVLPTGSGKTFTVVHWLLKQMERDPQLRVLWIADQQELVDQAGRAFEKDATSMSATFQRRLRTIHSAAGPASALADGDLDIACVTRQSLVTGGAAAMTSRLTPYLTRPVIVVVDEAHHAVATTYEKLLTEIERIAIRPVLLGLTATPWPSGQGGVRRLNDRFPRTLAEVDMLTLIQAGVLAIPVIHTVPTGEHVRLAKEEREQLRTLGDFPASVLQRLDQDARNALLIKTWATDMDKWDKTVVFVGTVSHADHLGEAFVAAGARCSVLHSRSTHPKAELLAEFRAATGPTVLVSVDMLREGVDIPDVRTAILARPTASTLVLRQMVGRVLRGPKAGGGPVAHIVTLEDHWVDGVDVLSPVDLQELTGPDIEIDAPEGSHRLPPVLDETTATPIPESVLRRIELAYAELSTHPSVPVTDSSLVGFYQLIDLNVPVFAHTKDAWGELISARLAGQKLATRSPRDLFEDLAVPRPTIRDVDAVVDYLSSSELEPPLITVTAHFSLRTIASKLWTEPGMTQQARFEWERAEYEATLARSVYSSFHAFSEALGQELLALSGQVDVAFNPESLRPAPTEPGLPSIRPDEDRALQPLLAATTARGRTLLRDADEAFYANLLDYAPEVAWTRQPTTTSYATWAARISGKAKGRDVIRVNKLLQAVSSQVPDELLEFLLWHELCHHMLPAHGHDAEFYRLLVLWPEQARLDYELDSLPERLDLGLRSTVAR